MIKNLILEHKGGYYNYKVNHLKLNKIPNKFNPLKNYLEEMFVNCPNEYFNSGPRGSGLKFKLNNLRIHQISGHEISDLATQAVKINRERFKDMHPKIQVFLLENDDKTIAMEIPIWINPEELKGFSPVFKTRLPLTGHIDLLRIENDKIWIWDYKPNSIEEKYAATQVYFYTLMLSKRTKIDLENFRCGYFDQKYAYVFKPELSLINTKPLIEFL
jgi:hypothetical protein